MDLAEQHTDIIPDYTVIDTSAALKKLAVELENTPRIGVDLEADSMYHFREKVCLVQISTDSFNAVVDAVNLHDLSPLKPVFARHDIQKIFHGADYDIRSLYRDFRIRLVNLFDTQLASMFMGCRETGLDAVLHHRFGVSLDKKYQRRDWSRRPLPAEMIEYAARDVCYLIPLARQLHAELKEKGRLEWVREECRLLSKVRPAEVDDSPLFLTFKGAGRLKRRSLAVLESLLQWRRDLAQKKDRPLFRIIDNATLKRIAQAMPSDETRLKQSKMLSNRQYQMYATPILNAVRRASALPETALPTFPRRRAPKPQPEVPERIHALKVWRDRTATALDMDPGILFNKALIGAVAQANPRYPDELKAIEGMKTWQRKAFGNEIIRVLARV